jgi:superfamily II DNA or RNA helicase
MFILKKINAQSYALTAERGKADERDKAVQSIIFKHRKHVEGYQFSQKYKSGAWDGFVYNYRPSNIRAGFLKETIEHLNNFQVEWKWEDDKIPESLPFYTQNEFDPKEFSEFCANYLAVIAPKYKEKYDRELQLRAYQIESSYKCLVNKTGICLHATGAGKSLTISLVLAFLFHKKMISKAAIVVPRQSLTTQFKNDLIDFGFQAKSIGLVLSSQKQTTKPITIIMNQSLRSMEDTLEETEFLKEVDFVVCDEVHTAAAKTVTQSILKFEKAKYFLGFTGTLPESELDRDTVHSLFGYVLDEQKVKDLDEYLAEVTVGILTFTYGDKARESRKQRSESTKGWNEEVKFLQEDDKFRNPYIANIINQNYNRGGKIVLLVKNIEYGLKMFKMIRDLGAKNSYWIEGSMPLKERDEIINKVRSSDDSYVIVTNFSIFSTGINIPNINLVVFADSSKSKITVAQSIGRGIRRTEIKTKVNILDCSCDLKYGSKHGRKRKKLYEDEGFKVVEKFVSQDPSNAELERKMQCLRDSV